MQGLPTHFLRLSLPSRPQVCCLSVAGVPFGPLSWESTGLTYHSLASSFVGSCLCQACCSGTDEWVMRHPWIGIRGPVGSLEGKWVPHDRAARQWGPAVLTIPTCCAYCGKRLDRIRKCYKCNQQFTHLSKSCHFFRCMDCRVYIYYVDLEQSPKCCKVFN